MNWEMFVIGQALVLAGAMIKIWNDSEVKIARLQERLTSAEDKDATLFKKLEHKTYDSKKEMDILDALEEVRQLKKQR